MKHDVRLGVLDDTVCQSEHAYKSGCVAHDDNVDCFHVNVTSASRSDVNGDDVFDRADSGGGRRVER